MFIKFLLLLTFTTFSVFGESLSDPFARSGFTTVPTSSDDYEDVNSKARKSEIFDSLFEGAGYDTKLRPPGISGGRGPTVINVSLHIRSIENINDVRMEYSVQMTFRQEWVDPRLRFDGGWNGKKYSQIQNNIRYLQLVKAERIWMPDIFFSNEKQGLQHTLMIPNLFTRIYPDGKVLQSYRITLLLSCPMNLQAYPLDVQMCPIQMASYGWTTEDIVLHWREKNAVEMARDFNMPRFKMQEHTTLTCNSVTITGNYSCIKLDIAFEREFGFYLIQIYIPCSMLSLVSWVTFWLEPTAVEARVSLGVTTILAIVTQTYGINQSAPPASYIKAMDVWTAFCQAMVFGALLEFSFVNYITHFRLKRQVSTFVYEGFNKEGNYQEDETMLKKMKAEKEEAEAALTAKALGIAKMVDKVARILFPVIFAVFNVIYWGYYLNIYFDLLDEFQAKS